MTMDLEDTRVPVTVPTGFLGAGKTTLLNHLIRDPEAGRIAVIMNEFGDAGLDHDLIEEATEETILMQSGCLCCSIRGDLLKTLGKLIARRDHGDLSFDRVVIETTGIADPGPILHSLVVDNTVAPRFRMDGVVTLADAAMGSKTLEKQTAAINQIAMAGMIVLSKTDLVTPNELAQFDAQIADINGAADSGRTRARSSRSSVRAVSNAPKRRVRRFSDWMGLNLPKPDPLAGISGFGSRPSKTAALSLPQTAPHAQHDHRINSASIEVEDPIPANVFDFWLDTLIALNGPDILRMKGIVHVEGMDWPFVFHGVQHIFDTPVPLKSWSGKDTTNKIVVIARDTDKSDLEASVATLQIRPKEEAPGTEGMMVQTTEMPF